MLKFNITWSGPLLKAIEPKGVTGVFAVYAPLLHCFCCDRFDCGSRQTQCEPVDLETEDNDIALHCTCTHSSQYDFKLAALVVNVIWLLCMHITCP